MTMQEIQQRVSFNLGIPSNVNVEELPIEQAIMNAFQELKGTMKTPVNKTVPFSTRIDLLKVGIRTKKVLYVQPAYPKVGLALSNVDSGNIFALAASVKNGAFTVSGINDMSPIIQQVTMAQTANTMSTDFQWTWDQPNQVVYCTCKQSRPGLVTVRYVPDYQDVSEIDNETWINYLLRLSEAYMKRALGRSRSKYKVEGSNVTLDGEILLQEATDELNAIREELKSKKKKLVVLN